jgi:hypothetical protein
MLLLAVAPAYLLVLNWNHWLTMSSLAGGTRFFGITLLPNLLADSALWSWVVREATFRSTAVGVSFGLLLLASDLLLAWTAAAIGARLGAGEGRRTVRTGLAATAGAALWGLRLFAWNVEPQIGYGYTWYSGLSFAFATMKVLTAAWTCLAVFVWFVPLFADWARRAMVIEAQPVVYGDFRSTLGRHLARWLRSDDAVPSGGCLLLAGWQCVVASQLGDSNYALLTDPFWLALTASMASYLLVLIVRRDKGSSLTSVGSHVG